MATSVEFLTMINAVVQSPAFWAVVGAIGVKVIDFIMFKKKTHSEVVSSAYSAVNEAQKQLVEGLFQQVGLLNEEVGKLKAQVADRDRALADAKTAIDNLTREVMVLKGSAPRPRQ
jgi:hypothetical protein